jgi:hypothetical protein
MWISEALVGKTIIGVRVKSPSLWLEVEGGGWIEINVEGDCCSTASIDAVRLDGKPTLTGKIEEISFPAQPTEQEVDELTAVRLDGERVGSVSILHRNSSNGYYGNYLSVNSRGTPPDDAVSCKEWYREMS